MIVPVFIPFEGCPHRCVFCEQEKITSKPSSRVGADRVRGVIEQALTSPRFSGSVENEVAFYGGTFTNLPAARISELLGAAAPFLEKGFFSGIRVSTRPDAVDESICSLLGNLGVRTVELGAQSMNDRVLSLSGRGHNAADTMRAAELLADRGFRVGIQLMPGLPGDSKDGFTETVSSVISLRPAMVRIYPAVVIRGTALERMYREGRHCPLGLEEAIGWCSDACTRFEAEGIPVIRLGLMNSSSLREPGRIIGGPWHEAFGHMVRSRVYLRKISPMFAGGRFHGRAVIVKAPPGDVQLLRGHKNQGLDWIETCFGARITSIIPDGEIPPGALRVESI